MGFQRHGIAIGMERIDRMLFVSMKITGRLTHEDYQNMTPMLESALGKLPGAKINAFVDCSEMEGWELKALWDDLKLGVKHGRRFERVAILGNRRWQQYLARVASWFIAGEARFFDTPVEAFSWLNGTRDPG